MAGGAPWRGAACLAPGQRPAGEGPELFITILKGSHLAAMKILHPFRVRGTSATGRPRVEDPRMEGGDVHPDPVGIAPAGNEDLAPLQGAGYFGDRSSPGLTTRGCRAGMFIPILKGSHLAAMKILHPFRVRGLSPTGGPRVEDPGVKAGVVHHDPVGIAPGGNEDLAPLQGAGSFADR
jgi:hypothetical protein